MKDNVELDLPTILDELIKKKFLDFHVSLPGKITEIDRTKQKCKVKPLIMQPEIDGDPIELPVITNVPLIYPKGQKGHIYIPLFVDDYVTLFFTDYSLDNWLVQGGTNLDPQDERSHQLTDCIAFPGLIDFQNPIDLTNPENVSFKNGETEVELNPTGKILMKNSANELIDLINQLCEACESITTLTALGVQPVINKAVFTALKNKIATFKG